MTWNYRIVEKNGTQGIHEVYYDNGEPTAVTENPVEIVWDVGNNACYIRNQIMQAFDQPVLYYDSFGSKTPF